MRINFQKQRKSNPFSDSIKLALAGSGNTLEEGGRVLVKSFASKMEAHIAGSFLKVLNESKINSQHLLRVRGKKIYLEFLPGQQLRNLRERGIQKRIAHFQAKIHSLDWSGVLVNIDSRQEYSRYFRKHINRLVENCIISITEANELCRKFEDLMPGKMFDGLIHGNIWTGNILVHEGELFLIDFGSVAKLSLEYDLLYANRTLTRRVETWVKGWCSLDTKYIKHYEECGGKARAIIKNLEEDYSFYYAFHAAFKAESSLRANDPKMARYYVEKLGRVLGTGFMKIFITALSDLSLSKGNVTHILEVVGQLAKMGHDITLFVPKYGLYKEELPFRVVYVPLVQIPVRGLSFFSGLISFQIALLFCLIRHCLKQKPDAIYSRHDVFIMAPSVLTGLFHIPLFSEVNGVFSDELSFRGHGIAGIWINNLIERFAYKRSKRIIVVTEGIKEYLTKVLGIEREKISVISNGADIEQVKPQDSELAKQRLGISSASYVIGYLGNFEYYQGIEYLIRGLPDVLKKYPGVCCLLVGDGSLKSTIETLTKELGVFDSCVFTGAVPHSEVGAYLAAMDVCVAPKIPIKSGYSPLKLYEYMSAGRPVIASDTSGFELLEEYCCGLLVKPQDPASLADETIELLDDPERRFEMGRNARLYMEEFGSWEKVISKVEDLIKKEVIS